MQISQEGKERKDSEKAHNQLQDLTADFLQYHADWNAEICTGIF